MKFTPDAYVTDSTVCIANCSGRGQNVDIKQIVTTVADGAACYAAVDGGQVPGAVAACAKFGGDLYNQL